MAHLRVERTIQAPPESVFDWLADPANLTSAPLVLTSGWAPGSPNGGLGAVRRVIATGMWFREEITAYERPHCYSYLILSSFPAFDHDGGTLTFTPSGDGTHVEWVSSYTHPLHGGAKAVEALSSRLLPWNFDAILKACATALER